MSKKVLFTSFDTWLPHQSSNSSDVLLLSWQKVCFIDNNIIFLRQLPVDIFRASERTIKALSILAPDVVICCGMAESRYQLTLESNATSLMDKLENPLDLSSLISPLSHTAISHNAGKFVCEGLYYQVLRYLKKNYPQNSCLFVHVPLLNTSYSSAILNDFYLIVEQAKLF